MANEVGRLRAFIQEIGAFEVSLQGEGPFELGDYVAMRKAATTYRHQLEACPKIESEKALIDAVEAQLNSVDARIKTIGNRIFRSLAPIEEPEHLMLRKRNQLFDVVAVAIGEIQDLFSRSKGPIPRARSEALKIDLQRSGILPIPGIVEETRLNDFPAAENILNYWVNKMFTYTNPRGSIEG